MSVQDPASSFGAPGGAWEFVFWAKARSGEETCARTSRTRSTTKAAAPRTWFILARTRGPPVVTGRVKVSRSRSPTTVPPAADERILHERTVPYHPEDRPWGSKSQDFREDQEHRPLPLRWSAVTLRRSQLFRREEDAWETVGGDLPGRTSKRCARNS